MIFCEEIHKINKRTEIQSSINWEIKTNMKNGLKYRASANEQQKQMRSQKPWNITFDKQKNLFLLINKIIINIEIQCTWKNYVENYLSQFRLIFQSINKTRITRRSKSKFTTDVQGYKQDQN